MSKNLSELLGRKGVVDNLFDKLGNNSKENGSRSIRPIIPYASSRR